MIRLVVILAFAFVGLQFPSYYFAYIYQLEADTRVLESGSTPQHVIDSLRAQQRDLMLAEPFEWPMAFADAFHPDRAGEALFSIWEPRMPEQGVEWAYGGAGLVLGFLVTGIIGSVFGGGRRRVASPQPARRQVSRPEGTPARQAVRQDAPAKRSGSSGSVWAKAGATAKPRQAGTGSRIPISKGSLREASEAAKAALQQARQAVASPPRDPAVDSSQPGPLERRAPAAVQRAEAVGAVIPSRYRPPAITRRFESGHAGPIEFVSRRRA